VGRSFLIADCRLQIADCRLQIADWAGRRVPEGMAGIFSMA
jgi:hypothetical protein